MTRQLIIKTFMIDTTVAMFTLGPKLAEALEPESEPRHGAVCVVGGGWWGPPV